MEVSLSPLGGGNGVGTQGDDFHALPVFFLEARAPQAAEPSALTIYHANFKGTHRCLSVSNESTTIGSCLNIDIAIHHALPFYHYIP